MTTADVLAYLGFWSLVGCLVFSVFVVVVFRTGIVWAARGEDGLLKEEMSWRGRLSTLTVPLGIIGLQFMANAVGIRRQAIEPRFWSLFLLNLAHYAILLLYDTIVIDIVTLSLWRPAFLKLPDAIGWESMKQHAIISIPIGTAAGLILSAVTTAISYFVFFNG